MPVPETDYQDDAHEHSYTHSYAYNQPNVDACR